VSDDVTIGIGVDTSEATVEFNTLMVKADEATKRAREARKKIMREISMATAALSSMLTSFSMAMSLLGAQVDTFFGALIGMTLSTVSMLVSIATGLAATGVGIPASIIVMGIAVSLQIITIAKLINDKMSSEGIWNEIKRAAQKGIYMFKHPASSTGAPPLRGFG
jgi:hypothetical protein